MWGKEWSWMENKSSTHNDLRIQTTRKTSTSHGCWVNLIFLVRFNTHTQAHQTIHMSTLGLFWLKDH